MKVNRSSYYYWKNKEKSNREKEQARLIPLVRDIFNQTKQCYGTRRISDELKANGESCGRYKARTLMRLAQVTVNRRRKYKVTTTSKHDLPVFPNLLERNFTVSEPNRVWVSDITYLQTTNGWLYLAVIIDLYSRRVVGWSMNNRIDRHLVMDALRMGIWRRHPDVGLLFHSDRGSQYCSNDFRKLLQEHAIIGSMSRKGNCWDNAVVESFFSRLKTESLYGKKYQTRERTRQEIVDYIEMFYNNRRRHSFLGNISPAQFENLRKIWIAA